MQSTQSHVTAPPTEQAAPAKALTKTEKKAAEKTPAADKHTVANQKHGKNSHLGEDLQNDKVQELEMTTGVTTDVGKKVMKTLAVDIGGSGIKALLLDPAGVPLGDRGRIKTPKPATPEAVMAVIERLVSQQGDFDRVSVGFPGVVRKGVVYTAVNLHPDWQEYDLVGELSQRVGKPVRAANDADLQGMGAVSGDGVEMVITLGTGFGTALFTDGHLVANLEFGHQRFRKGQTYEEQLGRAALKKIGQKTWNTRLLKAIDALSRGFNYDRLYLGGGEVKQINVELPENVTVVSNVLGLIGGIKLWDEAL